MIKLRNRLFKMSSFLVLHTRMKQLRNLNIILKHAAKIVINIIIIFKCLEKNLVSKHIQN